ncbi:DNA repair protein RecO [Undibacterium piscinae]|jgi:DNA repair protein RecO (recombination protein O)|uniref:DNA repair protein RecO n=1 Tax=Undibacterium piscinae TaxID=2495591 RepID=A0A6M4A221_9BURK|nr:DNA repair protein RecO [Undibacterium piscinae]
MDSAASLDVRTPPESAEVECEAAVPVRQAKLLKRVVAKGVRIASQPGFVLHSYPYKETSLIIEVFSRDYGRVALVAKGAKRPHSQLRNVLQTFQPLSMGWSGKSDIRTLISAEWVGGMLPLEKSGLLCGFYLNELLVKFLVRDEPHPVLFDHYVSTLNQLAHHEPAPIVLRKFEQALLSESGLIADLSYCTVAKTKVIAEKHYVIDPETGARPARIIDKIPHILGQTLLDMQAGEYQDAITQSQSKMLMRYLLAHHLHGIPLNTRQILIDLQKL